MLLPLILSFYLISLILTLFLSLFYFTFAQKLGLTLELSIFPIDVIDYSLSFTLDWVSLGYLMCVVIVTSCVLVFTIFYMSSTLNYRRFVYTLLFFVTSMLTLIMSDSFITLMIGWDGLGITSFCLVIFYESASSLSSGVITIFTNRLGDSLLIGSFFYHAINGGFSSNFFVTSNPILFLLLIGGSLTKSAQIPFCSWLPAAMAAPTPISSLVHSSTLVTAGVYLVTRFNYMFFSIKPIFLSVCVLTMFIGGAAAVVESDQKKLVAMSTLSQLGLMMYTISLGLWKLSVFHMMLHSFFKSLMFVSTGGMILFSSSTQDFRQVSPSLNNRVSSIGSMSSVFSLMGFPFLVGFYSKDLIISNSLHTSWWAINVLFLTNCVITVVYSLKFICKSSCDSPLGVSLVSQNNSIFLFSSILVLWSMCSFAGFMFYFVSPLGLHTFKSWEVVAGLLMVLVASCNPRGMHLTDALVKSFNSLIYMNWVSMGGLSKSTNISKIVTSEVTWMETLSMIHRVTKSLKKMTQLEFPNSMKFLLFMGPTLVFMFT